MMLQKTPTTTHAREVPLQTLSLFAGAFTTPLQVPSNSDINNLEDEMVRWKKSSHHDASTTFATMASGSYTTGSGDEEGREWTAMLERLKEYKRAKGHCQADQDANEPELGGWVMSQRRHFNAITGTASGNKKMNYVSSSLNQERIQKLKEVGLDLEGTTIAKGGNYGARETADSSAAKRKTKVASEGHVDTRRPPKKRKKSLDGSDDGRDEAEERDVSSQYNETARGSTFEHRGERDDVSPATAPKPVKGRGDSAWETLMNVAALVPPLPTAVPPRRTSSTFSSSPSVVSNQGTPPTKATGGPKTPRYSDASSVGSAGKYRAANSDVVVPNQQRWEDMFSRLQLYKKKHGHCRVPNRFPEDPSLGSWVATQRRYFKNKNLPMPEDRVRRLTELGFEWTTKDPRKVPWETRFEGLRNFKEKYGHCDVPHEWEECPQLGFWTANMRQQYRYKQLGKKSSLTDDRIELLNSLGFVWKMQGGRRKKSDPVARPNQSPSEASPSPTSGIESMEITPKEERSPLVLDPMTTPKSGHVPVNSRRVSDASYIPPPSLPPIKQVAAAAARPMFYHV